MTDRYRGPAAVGRPLALALVAALLIALIPLAGTARAETEVTAGDGLVPTVRFAGTNRFDTAQLIATEDSGFQAGYSGDALIVATGDRFPDALAGAGLGGAQAAPIVLTPSTTATTPGELDPDLVEAIQGVSPTSVYVLGGTAAVSEEIAGLIEEEAGVAPERIGGDDRYETAALLADLAGEDLADSAEPTAVVARADDFADALVAGAISAAGAAAGDPVPILLTDPTGPVAPATAERLEDLGIERVIVAGGTAAVGEDVVDELETLLGDGGTVQRVSGPDRRQTAIAFARLAAEEFGFGTDHVNLARDDVFADALALGPHAGLDVGGPAPIVLADQRGGTLGAAQAYLEEIGGCDYSSPAVGANGVGALHVAGGLAAISETITAQAREALSAPGDACTVDLEPETASALVGEPVALTATVTDNTGAAVDPAAFDEPLMVSFMAMPESGTPGPAPESVTVEVDEEGTATYEVTSELPGDLTVTAAVMDADGTWRTSSPSVLTFALPAAPEAAYGISGTGATTRIVVSGEGDLGTEAVDSQAADAPLSGVPDGQTLVAMDFRPATRQLYAISDSGVVYSITLGNSPNAVATAIDLDGDFTGGVAFDFNPAADRLRVVTPDGTNAVVNVDTGDVTDQPAVRYAEDDPNEGIDPEVTAAAYTDGVFGETATATTLYDIDSGTNTLAVQTVATGPANGELTTVGTLGTDVADTAGFDVSGNSGIAYAALDPADAAMGLYVVDLGTGAALRVGDLPAGLTAFAVAPRVLTEGGAFLQADNQLILVPNLLAAQDDEDYLTLDAGSDLPDGEQLLGLDWRDSDGHLYAFGSDLRVYRLELPGVGGTTYVATALSEEPLNLDQGVNLDSGVGFDVNPVADRLRIVTGDGWNYRVNPESATAGTALSVDGNLTYAEGDAAEGEDPEVTAAAYTGNVAGSTTTTLYGIDTAAGTLVRQDPPNAGTLHTVGGLNADLDVLNGFDISGVTGDAYLVAPGEGDATPALFRVDLDNGDLTFIGPAVDGALGTQTVGFTLIPVFTDTLDAELSPANEVPPVDTTATGMARLRVNVAQNLVCATIAVAKEGDDGTYAGSPGAHIHAGPAGVNGPIVVHLPTPSDAEPPLNGRSGGCVAPELFDVADLVAAPEQYYVNVHTNVHPSGLVRDQLAEPQE